MKNLFIISTEDIDAVLSEKTVTPRQREKIYNAVARMDASPVFEIIDTIIDETTREFGFD